MFTRKLLIATTLAIISSFALSQQVNETGSEITFQNGIQLRITILQGAENRVDVVGSLTFSPPHTVHRLFWDSQDRFLFGYDVDAVPTSRAGEFQIDLKPLETSFSSSIGQPATRVPTLEHAHTVGRLKVGDYFAMHVFIDSGTGGEIRDLIQLLGTAATGVADRSLRSSAATSSLFQLTDLRVSVNGKEITGPKPLRSVSGPYPALYIPGRGSFFISLHPVENLPFLQAGTVSNSKLRFTVGEDLIECTSRTPILPIQDVAQIWVWHEPNYKLTIRQIEDFIGPSDPTKLQIAVADSIDVWRDLVHGTLF